MTWVTTPYDVAGAELGHHGEECSFDAFYAWCPAHERQPSRAA
jgi:hypothetical protein